MLVCLFERVESQNGVVGVLEYGGEVTSNFVNLFMV